MNDLFVAIDAKPFKPFVIEIIGGRLVPVVQPDNIFVLPNRRKVVNIWVYGPGYEVQALIYPEGIAAIHPGGEENAP